MRGRIITLKQRKVESYGSRYFARNRLLLLEVFDQPGRARRVALRPYLPANSCALKPYSLASFSPTTLRRKTHAARVDRVVKSGATA